MGKRLRILFVLLWGGCLLYAQPSQVIPPIGELARKLFEVDQHDIRYNGKDYRLYMARPANGGNSPRPVLYMLDGNGQFPVLLNAMKEVSDSTPLIVGIGYPSPRAFPKERTRDYTIPVEENDEGGGAEDFYRFLVEEVKPFVEAAYAVDTARTTLCGHSYGGLFVLYVAFDHSSAFRNYVAGSPALWWGQGAVVPKHRPLFVHPPQSVTITLGEYEKNPAADESRKRLSPEVRKAKERRTGGVAPEKLASLIAEEVPDCRFILYEGKNHGSSVPQFLQEALRVAGGGVN